MAEAFFNQMAKGRAQASSAGTQPTDRVNPVVVEAMQEVGLDISANKPKLLTFEMVEKVERMITMGCGAEAEALCPASVIETEDWALDDPKGRPIEQVRRIREEIQGRVTKLIDEMDNSARFAETTTDDQILKHLVGVAQDLGLPPEAQRFTIKRTEHPRVVVISTRYTVTIVFPFKKKVVVLTPASKERQF